MKVLRIALAVFLITLVTFAQRPLDSAKVDQMVSADMAAKLTPAVQIAIAKDGQIVYSKGFGIVDEENDLKATPQTLFRTGSIAKQLTALAALTLAHAGKLNLDAPVQTYCPAFPFKQWTITTRELLGHTSGIRHYRGDEDVTDSTKHNKFMADGMAIFENDPLLFEPGTDYNYSTYGYTVAGCVIEGAAHEPYFDYLRRHVLQPAGMEHTAVDDVFAIVPRRARGYRKENGKIENAGLLDSSYKIPGGGLRYDRRRSRPLRFGADGRATPESRNHCRDVDAVSVPPQRLRHRVFAGSAALRPGMGDHRITCEWLFDEGYFPLQL